MGLKKTLDTHRRLQASGAFASGRRVAALVIVALSVLEAVAAPVLAGGEVSAIFPALPAGAVKPASDFNERLVRAGGGWTGGDGTYSVPLPDGRTVWIFGDSFLGRVDSDRTRPKNSPLIHNCFVIQTEAGLQTLHAGAAGAPRALVAPSDGSGFYWPGDGWVEKDRLHVLFNRFLRTGIELWQWRWIRTEIVSFSLPAISRVAARPLKAANRVMYGSAILEYDGYVYVYGTEDLGQLKQAHVARFPDGAFTSRWQYFAGHRWSSDAATSARLLAGVSNQFSVLKVARRYLLITTDSRLPFDPTIVIYSSPSPTGPWAPGFTLYEPPEAGAGVVAYNALAHPQFTVNDWLLVSYNLNHAADANAVYRDADLYRPRFIRVNLKTVIDSLSVP